MKRKCLQNQSILLEIELKVLLVTNTAIYALQKRSISSFWLSLGLSRDTIYTTKVFYPGLRAAAINNVFSTSLTCLVIGKDFSII